MNSIKELRQQTNLTIRELSQKSGVAVGYISTLENDKFGVANPSKKVMEKIAAALNSTVPDVFFQKSGFKQ